MNQEAEVGGSKASGELGQLSEILKIKNKNKKVKRARVIRLSDKGTCGFDPQFHKIKKMIS